VQLLVTVEERQPRIVGDEVKFQFLESAQHHHVLDHPRGRFTGDARQFEAVPVQVQRVDVVARVAEFQPVAAPLMHRVHRLHGVHRKSVTVQGPLIETFKRAVVLDDRDLDRLVRRGRHAIRVAKSRVIPAERFWLDPLRLALLPCVFHDDTHPMPPVVIREIAHNPHAGMLHFDERRDAFRGPEPEHRHVKASAALDDYRDQLKQLTGAVRLSLDNAKSRSDRRETPDEWLLVSEAQYRLLTANNAGFVRNAYRAAKNALGERFQLRSEMSQVAIFHRLGLLADNCGVAFAGLGATPADLQPKEPPPRDRVVVATGHRADAPSRPPPGRFPNTAACIDKAKGWLREALQAEKAETAGTFYGIAGAASGVDLLFHEVCKELGVPTKVCLPIPIEAYRRESVADGDPDWVEKFNRLIVENPPVILSDSDELPAWTAGIKDYSVFQRGNIWNMQDALLRPNADVTLVALWNQRAGEGPGGTADMVKLAKSHGAKVRERNSDELFGIASS
jgi:hypothetical protein